MLFCLAIYRCCLGYWVTHEAKIVVDIFYPGISLIDCDVNEPVRFYELVYSGVLHNMPLTLEEQILTR